MGYLGYDHVAVLEPTVPLPEAGPDLPESRFVVADTLVRFDHAASVAEVLVGDPEEVSGRLAAEVERRARGPRRGRAHATLAFARGLRGRGPPREGAHPRRRRLPDRPLPAGGAADRVSALALYRSLRRINPSPYHFLLELDGVSLVGSSPETLVKLEGTRASLNPIAGTTSPGAGDAERLLASEKDKAEHVMLVDLGRNDLSRVCEPGTVRVVRFLEAERYSHVTHLVSEVAGELSPGRTAFDLLRACFPAGTVSGAPKVRAMQIISGARGLPARPVRGCGGLCAPGRVAGHLHRHPHRDPGRRARPAAGGRGPRRRLRSGAEHEECLRKLAALEAALADAEQNGSGRP